jgi:hypothetical protein
VERTLATAGARWPHVVQTSVDVINETTLYRYARPRCRSTLGMWSTWHCCKVSDEAAFCLIQRPYISKTLLTRRISPRDHHNKMLRPGLCVVHASPQYL